MLKSLIYRAFSLCSTTQLAVQTIFFSAALKFPILLPTPQITVSE